jgi:hypothetical protein
MTNFFNLFANITILALQKKIIIMDSVNVQIYKNNIGKLIFVKKNIDFDRNIKKIILYAVLGNVSISHFFANPEQIRISYNKA